MAAPTSLDQISFPVPENIDPADPIVVIDDQQDLRLILCHHLAKLNFRDVRQATNGLEALEVFKDLKKPPIVLCDSDMPVMSGIDLLAELREKPDAQRGPFCLMMDNVSKEKVMLAVESGTDEMIVKPFKRGDIVPKLRAAFKVFYNPKNPERVYELAKTHLRANQLDDAASVYGILHQANPKAARPLVGLARVAIAQGKHEEAMTHLAAAEANNPNYVHLYTVRADVYAAASDWPKVIDCYKKAISLSPLNPLRYQTAVELLFKVEKYKDASELLELADKHQLNFPGLHHFRSQAQFALKDYAGATKSIKLALATKPDNVLYLNQLGICYKEEGLYEDAAQVYNKAIKLDPENISALYNKAVLLNTKGECAEAIKLMERVLKKQPQFKQATSKVEEFKKNLKDLQEAKKKKEQKPAA